MSPGLRNLFDVPAIAGTVQWIGLRLQRDARPRRHHRARAASGRIALGGAVLPDTA